MMLKKCCKCSSEQGQRLGSQRRKMCNGCCDREDIELARRREAARIQAHERTAERLEEETAGALVRNLWTQVSRDVEQFKYHHTRKLLNRVYRAEHDKNIHSAAQFPTHPISGPISDDWTRHQAPNYDDYPLKISGSPCSPSLSTPSPLLRTQSLQLQHELDNRTILEMQSAAHNSHRKVGVSGTATQAWCLLQGGGLQEEGSTNFRHTVTSALIHVPSGTTLLLPFSSNGWFYFSPGDGVWCVCVWLCVGDDAGVGACECGIGYAWVGCA